MGCGHGGPAVYLVLNGSSRVVGVDVDAERITFARHLLKSKYSNQSLPGEFCLPSEVPNEQFDIVMSKDSFQHYENPEEFIFKMKQFMKPRSSKLVIGLSQLWKSHRGGHIYFMTPLPWAHLLFPEEVIMRERRRFRPEEQAMRFSEILGGLNKMTLARFQFIINSTGLNVEYFAANASATATMKVCNLLRSIPLLREYFTTSVYAVLGDSQQ
jgi:hypothetical protein